MTIVRDLNTEITRDCVRLSRLSQGTTPKTSDQIFVNSTFRRGYKRSTRSEYYKPHFTQQHSEGGARRNSQPLNSCPEQTDEGVTTGLEIVSRSCDLLPYFMGVY